MKLSPISCPVCGSRELHTFSAFASDIQEPYEFTLKECRHCNFAWQWPPVRDFNASIEHAKSRYTKPQQNQYYSMERRDLVASTQLGALSSLVESPGRVLDIGAGDGAFVRAAARSGWQAFGLDPAAPEETAGNPTILRCTTGELKVDELFDVVTLWDVIEHLDEPAEVIRQSVEFLKPGGWIIVETGNYQSVNRLLAAKRWWAFAADHRWYFAPPIVEGVLIGLGLGSVSCGNRVLRPDWSGNCRSSAPSLRRLFKRILSKPQNLFGELRRYLRARRAWTQWPRWGGLSIFHVYGQKPKISSGGADV